MEVEFYYVREKVLCRDSCVHFVSGKDNFADIFTKPLPTPSLLHQWPEEEEEARSYH